MALNQVGARTEGDVYQGLFFWRQAADLLRPQSRVERVVLEHDKAAGVDDVAVFYRQPGVNAGGWTVTAVRVTRRLERQDRADLNAGIAGA